MKLRDICIYIPISFLFLRRHVIKLQKIYFLLTRMALNLQLCVYFAMMLLSCLTVFDSDIEIQPFVGIIVTSKRKEPTLQC